MKVENKKTINEDFETWKKSKKDLSENTKLVHTKETLVLKENKSNKVGLSEDTLNKDFKDLWSLKENTYTFKCRGRKELRQLISECKEKNIRYKFDKTLDETYRYLFTCKVKPLKESQSQEIRASYEQLADMNNMTFKEFDKLMADFIRERNHENDMEPLYSERLWTEFKNWAKDERNIAIKDFGDVEKDEVLENKEVEETKPMIKESFLTEQVQDKQEDNVKLIGESRVTDKLKLRRHKKFESKVEEEPVKQEKDEVAPVQEAVKKDYFAYKKELTDAKDLDELRVVYKELKKDDTIEDDDFDKLQKLYIELKDDFTKEPKEEKPVEEAKKDEKPLEENLQLIGKLEDFTPSEKAKPLWDLIVSKDLVGDLNKILGDLYPSGTNIQDFDDLLVYSPDFVKKMLDIEDEEVQEDDIIDTTVEEPTEEKEVDLDATVDGDDDDISMIDRLDIEKGNAPTPVVQEEENKKPLAKEEFITTETGYGDSDYSEDDDDMSALDAVLALTDEEE